MTRIFKTAFFSLLLSLTLSACVYKINVQQGNLITDAAIAKLHAGMSMDDVTALFGTPLVNNVYHDNKITYVYTMKQGNHKMTRRDLTIYFVNNKLVSYKTQ